MEHVGIPKFDPKNKNHIRLSGLSKTLHQLRLDGKETEMSKLEEEVNATVWKLFEERKK